MQEITNNQVTLNGEVATHPEFSHEVYGEQFYIFYIDITRKSSVVDRLPVIVSDRSIDLSNLNVGTIVDISGNIRTHNKNAEVRNRLIISVFAREISISDVLTNTNNVFIDGFLCKAPLYRKTPTNREVTDLLIAVNRPHAKSDYIPSICWERNARYASDFELGQAIAVCGRFQSREYNKRISETEFETRTAYELSISRIYEKEEEE